MKPSQPVMTGGPTCAAGKFTAQTSLRLTIAWAYGVNVIQLEGRDRWPVAQSAFAIEGVPAGRVGEAQCHAMVQALLADRFKLAIHHDSRPMSIYAMTIAKNGPKLRLMGTPDPEAVRRNRLKACASGPMGWSMQELAGCLGLYLYPTLVVDHTGLTGLYEITLDFSPPNGLGGLLGDGPDAFSAVESQLGLKLEERKEPVEVIVIDHLKQPEAN